MFKHLLVPTDGSSLSQDAVARAVAFAKDAGARITFFYAEPEALGAISAPHLTQETHERLDGATHNILDAAQQVAQAACVACQQVDLIGAHPYELIIQAAESKGCELIFIASHGRRGVTALTLCSETQQVLTHSKISVLVYR